MSTTAARGPARGRPLSAESPARDFRCAVASERREDDLAGTATHLAAFLVLEHHGPWGVSAPRDSRLPAEVKRHLVTHKNIKVLMARRHLRAHRSAEYSAFLAVPSRSLLLTRTFVDPLELLDLDLDAVIRGDYPDWAEVERAVLRGVHPRSPRRVLRRARPPGRGDAVRVPARVDLGGLAHRRRPVQRQHGGPARGPLLRADGRVVGRRGRRAARAGAPRPDPAAGSFDVPHARAVRRDLAAPPPRRGPYSTRSGSCSATAGARCSSTTALPWEVVVTPGRACADQAHLWRRAAQPVAGLRAGLARRALSRRRSGSAQSSRATSGSRDRAVSPTIIAVPIGSRSTTAVINSHGMSRNGPEPEAEPET